MERANTSKASNRHLEMALNEDVDPDNIFKNRDGDELDLSLDSTDEDLMDIPLFGGSKPHGAEDDNVQPVIDRYLSLLDNLMSKINNLEIIESTVKENITRNPNRQPHSSFSLTMEIKLPKVLKDIKHDIYTSLAEQRRLMNQKYLEVISTQLQKTRDSLKSTQEELNRKVVQHKKLIRPTKQRLVQLIEEKETEKMDLKRTSTVQENAPKFKKFKRN